MTDHERTQYYQRATTWALDEQHAILRSLGRTRLIAGIAALIAILEAFALLLLMPLKTATMVPVLVDRQTGFVEVLNPDGRKELQANAALVNSLLAQYVIARESFNITDIGAEYHKVALWSGGSARQDYLALIPASNPSSPLRLYPRTSLVETSIKSVSPLGPHTALVRFETRRRDQDAQASASHDWASVVNYRFSNEALSASDRWLNPLGFQVVGYHRDAEAPMPADVGASTTDASPPSSATLPASNAPTANRASISAARPPPSLQGRRP
jgi:type IV secretion system protein VirB8